MQGNDILLTLKNKGMERGVTECLLRLAEEVEDHNKAFKEMAAAMDALARVNTLLNNALGNMSDAIDELKPKDGDPSSTRGMVG